MNERSMETTSVFCLHQGYYTPLLNYECDSERMTMTLLSTTFEGRCPSTACILHRAWGFSWLESG